MKASLALSIAVLAALPCTAWAQTAATAHAQTASALQCLLNNGQGGCRSVFVGSAMRAAKPWVWQNPNRDFELGPLLSAEYARTETKDNVYITKLLSGSTTDLYHVKFKRHEMTFYISQPEADGKIHYLLVRDGGPDDERRDLFVRGPG